MKLVAFVFGSVLILASAGTSFAEADCRRVNKMLEMGRSAQDIVENSAGTITDEDVERCKAEKSEGGGEEKKEEAK
jgi:hypothetical protein